MRKFRYRLILIFVGLIGVSNAIASIFTVTAMRDSQLEALEKSLHSRLQTYIVAVGGKVPADDSLQAEAERLAQGGTTRVTFLDGAGHVLGDSGNPTGQAGGTIIVALPVSFGTAGDGFVQLEESVEPINRETRQIAGFFCLGMLAMLGVTAAVASSIASRLTEPLEAMTRIANKITNKEFQSRITVPLQDEVGQLGQAINLMSESLQTQMDQIQENEQRLQTVLDNLVTGVFMVGKEGNVELMNRAAEELLGMSAPQLLGKPYGDLKTQLEFVRKIGECQDRREHLTDEVLFHYPEERTLDLNFIPVWGADGEWEGILVVLHDITAIRRLERMRSEFVANVSHELKTPIAAVKGFAETLMNGAADDPETLSSFLKIIHDESDRINRLISDILDLSKIESKRVPLHYMPVEMQSFSERMLQMMSPEAGKKHIELMMQVPADLYIEADEDRLQQIFVNLLSNAITHSHEEGKVIVTVEPVVGPGMQADDYERVRITVQDFGTGIPKKDLPRIFERFYRVDKARSRMSGGTGLGLSIVKHLVELHKGSIRAESTPGTGTRFYIELPALQ